MANKNTKQLRARVRTACKQHQDSVEYKTPVPDYHSRTGSVEQCLITKHCPTAIVKGDGVNSVNKRRNSCQRVYLNKGAGGTQSLTCHEPLLKNEPMAFPNHAEYKDWEYRRPGAVTASVSV